jgi:hypothetical protein
LEPILQEPVQQVHQLSRLAKVLMGNHSLTSLDLQLDSKPMTVEGDEDNEAMLHPVVRTAEFEAMQKKLGLNKLVDTLCNRLSSDDPALSFVSLHHYIQHNSGHDRTSVDRTPLIPAQKRNGSREPKKWKTNKEQDGVWENLQQEQHQEEQRWEEEIRIGEEVSGMRGMRPPSEPAGEYQGVLRKAMSSAGSSSSRPSMHPSHTSGASSNGSNGANGSIAALHVATALTHVARVVDACAMSTHLRELSLEGLDLGHKVPLPPPLSPSPPPSPLSLLSPPLSPLLYLFSSSLFPSILLSPLLIPTLSTSLTCHSHSLPKGG